MPSYSDYLELDALLELQRPGPEHDEMLFIVIHQVYELWFKQLLHEIDHLNRMLRENNEARAMHGLNRILSILKVLVAQLDILETMTPLEFLSFRDRLEAGSGFQSWQFRSIEFVLGLKDPRALDRYDDYPVARARLEKRLAEPTLWDAFLAHLALNGIPVPAADLGRDVTKRIEPSPALQPVLIDVYRHHPGLASLCERLVDLDEGLMEWRYRHVKMVQRTIGTKRGTGGSSGAEYLSRTLNQPLYPDLWAIRTEL